MNKCIIRGEREMNKAKPKAEERMKGMKEEKAFI